MNPTELYQLTEEQKKKYHTQPDNIPSYSRLVTQDLETTYYVKGAPFRFWFNDIAVSYTNHWQTSLEIIFATENVYTVSTGGQDYILEPGDILILPPGALHSIAAPDKGHRLIFLLELDMFSRLPNFNFILSLLSKPIHLSYALRPGLYEECAKGLLDLAECYWGDSGTKMLKICSKLIAWFAMLGDYAIEETPLPSSVPMKTSTLMNRLSKVMDYIDTHYSENITLEEAAQIACFSKFYFTRLFKQYTDQTFYDYLSTKRIHAAEQMLIVPNLAITEISLKSGFSSLSSFNRTFKRLKGCSPTEYRNLYVLGSQVTD